VRGGVTSLSGESTSPSPSLRLTSPHGEEVKVWRRLAPRWIQRSKRVRESVRGSPASDEKSGLARLGLSPSIVRRTGSTFPHEALARQLRTIACRRHAALENLIG